MKNIFCITIFGENYIVQHNGKQLVINCVNKLETKYDNTVIEYLRGQITYFNNDIQSLRFFLRDLQCILSNSREYTILTNVQKFCEKNIVHKENINSLSLLGSVDNNSKIQELKKMKDELVFNFSNEKKEEIEEGINLGGKQKVLSNGKSLISDELGKKDAFINALVLAVIVEAVCLFAFTLLLLKI